MFRWLANLFPSRRVVPPSLAQDAPPGPPPPQTPPGGVRPSDAAAVQQRVDPRLVLFPLSRQALDAAPSSAFPAPYSDESGRHFQSVRQRRTDPFEDENVPVIGHLRTGRCR
jgi:hypothetical protein